MVRGDSRSPILAALLEEVGRKESVNLSEETLNPWALVAKRVMHLPQTAVDQRATDFLDYVKLDIVDSKADGHEPNR